MKFKVEDFKFNEERDYDKRGNYIRDYEDMEVPFEELALPRNEEELERYRDRCVKDAWPMVRAIAECGDPRIEEEIEEVLNDPDEYYNSEEFQQIVKEEVEALKKKEFNSFDIVYYQWNHTDGSGSKDRPCLIFKKFNKSYVIMITSIKENGANKREFDIEVKRSRENGLTKDSYIRVSNMRKFTLSRVLEYKGRLESDYYSEFISMLNKVVKNQFNNPWLFMDWLVSEEVKETPPSNRRDSMNRKLQTINDIEKTKKANHFDVAVILHDILKDSKHTHIMVWDTCITKDNKNIDHLYVAFLHKNNYYVANFYDSDLAYIIKSDDKLLKQILIDETRKLTKYLSDNVEPITDRRNYVLDDNHIKYLDKQSTRDKRTQKQILDKFDKDIKKAKDKEK